MVSACAAQWRCYGYGKEVKPLEWWIKSGDVVQFKSGDFKGCYGTIVAVNDVNGLVYTIEIPMPYTSPITISNVQSSDFYCIGEKIDDSDQV